MHSLLGTALLSCLLSTDIHCVAGCLVWNPHGGGQRTGVFTVCTANRSWSHDKHAEQSTDLHLYPYEKSHYVVIVIACVSICGADLNNWAALTISLLTQALSRQHSDSEDTNRPPALSRQSPVAPGTMLHVVPLDHLRECHAVCQSSASLQRESCRGAYVGCDTWLHWHTCA